MLCVLEVKNEARNPDCVVYLECSPDPTAPVAGLVSCEALCWSASYGDPARMSTLLSHQIFQMSLSLNTRHFPSSFSSSSWALSFLAFVSLAFSSSSQIMPSSSAILCFRCAANAWGSSTESLHHSRAQER